VEKVITSAPLPEPRSTQQVMHLLLNPGQITAPLTSGWVHTAGWATLQIGSAADIINGVTYNANLTMTGAGNATTSTLDNPSFSIWTGGTTPTDTGGSGFHKYNQVRGPSGAGESNPVNDALTSGGVLTGSNGWIAYANAGFVVT
jgi:hypothetical protein